MPRARATAVGLTRPAGLSSGAFALVGAWIVALVIARLTGAAAVVIVLGAGFVGMVWAAAAGWFRLRSFDLRDLTTVAATTVGDSVTVTGLAPHAGAEPPMSTSLSPIADLRSPADWLRNGRFDESGCFGRRGIIDHLDVSARSAGGPGLLWWERRSVVAIDPVVVAPRPAGPGARIEIVTEPHGGGFTGSAGSHDGDVDGIRPWRDGDSERSVHWPTSLRTGDLVVLDRHRSADTRWIVRVDGFADDADVEAGRARWALDEGRRRGVRTAAAVGDADAVEIPDMDAAARWSATCIPDANATEPRWQRRSGADADLPLTPPARWVTAAATLAGLALLVGALGSSLLTMALLAAGTIAGAVVTTRLSRSGGDLPTWSRLIVASVALAGVAAIAVGSGSVSGLLAVLRGPLPQFLMLLVVLHGFECTDRRTARVELAISAVVATYAAGLRVDGQLGWWLAGWGACFLSAIVLTAREGGRVAGARPLGHFLRDRASARRAGPASVRGPPGAGGRRPPDRRARHRARALAGPRATRSGDAHAPGVHRRSPPRRRTRRARSHRWLDHLNAATPATAPATAWTSLVDTPGSPNRSTHRCEVTSPTKSSCACAATEPDFWRGQTFGEFDGRFWYADSDLGRPADGPVIGVPRAAGDSSSMSVPSSQFVQTYYVEVDQPNVLFAAYRPTRVIFDGTVWRRPDGALRSDVVLTEGAVYTVVSQRAEVTADSLRAQGDVTRRSRDEVVRYLQVPASTTDRDARELADTLAAPTTSTYDMVLAFEAWIGANVVYDLDSPTPAAGVDAVDDFLFTSRRGFCEQIASALAVMLRTQGVPARLATGYVPGERDRISGVWKVRASDAHAWVEVWFPDTGWQAFDPTANVPFGGEVDAGSVGGDVARGIGAAVGENSIALIGIVLAGALALGVATFVRIAVHRRRRGRWGLLQDRLERAAAARGIDTICSNPELARRWAVERSAPCGERARSGNHPRSG